MIPCVSLVTCPDPSSLIPDTKVTHQDDKTINITCTNNGMQSFFAVITLNKFRFCSCRTKLVRKKVSACNLPAKYDHELDPPCMETSRCED